MSANIAPFNNRSPFLIESRNFPNDEVRLQVTLNKMYIEIAQAVNKRTIGTYSTAQITTGNVYFPEGNTTETEESFRTIYTLASIASGVNTIPLGFTLTPTTQFVMMYGTANNPGVRSGPIPYVNLTTPTDGIELRVNWTTSNIEIVTTTSNWVAYSAIIVLEYILN